MDKLCPTCKTNRPIADFWRTKNSKDGLQYCCKFCQGPIALAWKKRNAQRLRDKRLRDRYGIEPTDFDSLLIEQGGVCAICGGPPAGRSPTLHVDHDHTTGRVRGLLCGPCNTALAQIEAKLPQLGRFVDYLTRTA